MEKNEQTTNIQKDKQTDKKQTDTQKYRQNYKQTNRKKAQM